MTTAGELMDKAEHIAAVYMPADSINPWGENPRRIPESAVYKVAISMCALGFGAPLLVRADDNRLVAGHTRLRAFYRLLEMAEKHGLPPEFMVSVDEETGEKTKHHVESPPWVDLDESKWPPAWYQFIKPDTLQALKDKTIPVRAMDLTEEEADELALADNRLGEEAEWDQDMLSTLLQRLPEEDHLLTGFDAHELEPLLAYQAPLPPELPEEGDGQEPPPEGSSGGPKAPLVVRLNPLQRASVEAAHAAAKEVWERPDIPMGEFLAELARVFIGDHPQVEEADPSTPSTGMCDF